MRCTVFSHADTDLISGVSDRWTGENLNIDSTVVDILHLRLLSKARWMLDGPASARHLRVSEIVQMKQG